MSGDPTESWPSDLQSPPEVPDFDLLRPIGRGAFGQVWLATNRTTGRLRAVKLIRLDQAGREIASLIRLEANVRNQHPNLLGIDHVGQTAQYLFYVMDPADDITGSPASCDSAYRPCTLKERLRSGPLSADDCSRHARQLVAGLAHIHKAGMVHRDVKPANCLFMDGDLKLGDFGLLAPDSTQNSRAGTPDYMPPDGQMDARADVYAAGLVMYEMLAGLPRRSFPHLGQRASEVAKSPLLRRLNRLILRACQPDPQQRFADAEEMLGQWAAAETEKPRPPARVWRRVFLASACLLVAIVLAMVRFWPSPPPAVDVSFITEPFGATIYLDGRLLMQPDGIPYTTPCTVPSVPARSHRVLFKRADAVDLDIGQIDVAGVREVTARWSTGSAPR